MIHTWLLLEMPTTELVTSVTGLGFHLKDITVKFCFVCGSLSSSTSRVPFSSITADRRQRSLQLMSPKWCNSQQINHIQCQFDQNDNMEDYANAGDIMEMLLIYFMVALIRQVRSAQYCSESPKLRCCCKQPQPANYQRCMTPFVWWGCNPLS